MTESIYNSYFFNKIYLLGIIKIQTNNILILTNKLFVNNQKKQLK